MKAISVVKVIRVLIDPEWGGMMIAGGGFNAFYSVTNVTVIVTVLKLFSKR